MWNYTGTYIWYAVICFHITYCANVSMWKTITNIFQDPSVIQFRIIHQLLNIILIVYLIVTIFTSVWVLFDLLSLFDVHFHSSALFFGRLFRTSLGHVICTQCRLICECPPFSAVIEASSMTYTLIASNY